MRSLISLRWGHMSEGTLSYVTVRVIRQWVGNAVSCSITKKKQNKSLMTGTIMGTRGARIRKWFIAQGAQCFGIWEQQIHRSLCADRPILSSLVSWTQQTHNVAETLQKRRFNVTATLCHPAKTQRRKNVLTTSLQRQDIAATLWRFSLQRRCNVVTLQRWSDVVTTFLRRHPAKTQHRKNVVTTSLQRHDVKTLLQRRCNVVTLQRRCNDVFATLCLCWGRNKAGQDGTCTNIYD